MENIHVTPQHGPSSNPPDPSATMPSASVAAPTIPNRELLTSSPVFRLLREHAAACNWLQTSQMPTPMPSIALRNSVAKEFQCHIPTGVVDAHGGVMRRRKRTLLYSPYMVIGNGVTLGCVFGSRYEQDQVWGLGWEDSGNGAGDGGSPTCCKFVYDEGNEESLTFIWNERKGEVAIIWVKGVSAWEMRRELFVFQYRIGSGSTSGGVLGVLEGKRRKVWLKVRQFRECENCGIRMDACTCVGGGSVDEDRKKLLMSPVDFTSFDVKVLDGVYQCFVEANIYNPDPYELLSRKSVKFTTEILNNNVDSSHVLRPQGSGYGGGAGQDFVGIPGLPGPSDAHALQNRSMLDRQILSERLIQHLQKCADVVKTEEESIGSRSESGPSSEQLGEDAASPVRGSSPMGRASSDGAEAASSSSAKRRNSHKTQPIRLIDIVNVLYRLEKEGDSSGSDNGRKRRKKRGPYRKRGEIDKATRDRERKLKNRELAHAANQKKRERTRAMELELRILRRAVRSILGYTRELEDVNSILAHMVAQSGEDAASVPQVSQGVPSVSMPATSGFPEIVPTSLPEEKPHVI